ncbi:MAG TPA: phage tail protein [Pyrinomonadaceae bacterium]|jgi:phage tail-like protein|nr:phage tail protein [Pyrinomonadaceae bacterium]
MADQAAQPSGSTYIDPYRAYNFKLEIQGVTEGHFTEITGMEASVAPISYREAGNSQVVHYVPGRTEYGAVTLRYGVTKSRELWDWFQTGVNGKIDRRNVSIVLLDSDGKTEVMRWNLMQAWATQWRGAFLDTRGQEVAIESVTLVCETLERA